MEISPDFFDVSFSKALVFGYKVDDVDKFVTKALDIITQLQEEKDVLSEKIGVLANSLEKYREEEDSLRSALIGAQKLGDSILKDSKNKAELIIRDATTTASHVVAEAHDDRERELIALDLVRKEAADFKDSLISLYRSHLDLIKNIPGEGTHKPALTSEQKQKSKLSSKRPAAPAPEHKQPEHKQPERRQPEHTQSYDMPEQNFMESEEDMFDDIEDIDSNDFLISQLQTPNQNTDNFGKVNMELNDDVGFFDEEDTRPYHRKPQKSTSPIFDELSQEDDEEDDFDMQPVSKKKNFVSQKFGALGQNFGDGYSVAKD